jgi:hypothetical protein
LGRQDACPQSLVSHTAIYWNRNKIAIANRNQYWLSGKALTQFNFTNQTTLARRGEMYDFDDGKAWTYTMELAVRK